jgi:COMPASS component SWD2
MQARKSTVRCPMVWLKDYTDQMIDIIRYLSTHDNKFIRYFRGHEAPVTCLAMNPGTDNFVSCGEDNTVRLWDANSANCCAKLYLQNPTLAAYDPSASVIAIASPMTQTILLYDNRKIDQAPFATFDTIDFADEANPGNLSKCWNKLEFSNDGKSLLLGTTGSGHYLIGAFDGKLQAYLHRERGGTNRLAAGELEDPNTTAPRAESSGDVAFTPDGRYVLGGSGKENVLVWDTLVAPDPGSKKLKPTHELNFKGSAAVLAANHRYNFFATADKEVVFWVPDGYGA